MTRKLRAEIQQRLEDQEATDRFRAYTQGYTEGTKDSDIVNAGRAYWILALGIILGSVIMEALRLF